MSRRLPTVRTIQLVENIQRKDLTPIDEGRAYSELLQYLDNNVAELARRVGKTPQHVNGRLRVIRFVDLAEAVNVGQIAYTVAREIIALPPEEADALRRRVREGHRVTHVDITKVRKRLEGPGPPVEPEMDGGAVPTVAAPALRASGDGYSAMPQERHTPAPTAREATPAAWDTAASSGTVQPDGAAHRPHATRAVPIMPTMSGAEDSANDTAAAPTGRRQPEVDADEAQRDGTAPTAGASRLNRIGGEGDGDTVFTGLLATFPADILPQLEEVVLYGVDHGWTCIGLLEHIRRARAP